MIRKLTLLASACFALTACGTNAPLSVIQTGDASIPELGMPVNLSNAATGFFNGSDLSSAAAFRFVLNTNLFTPGASITPLAPANGTIIEQNGTTITIMHNSRLSTRISNISALTVRLGDYVTKGTQLSATQFANVTGSNPEFTFEVILDGGVVCPWSFFSTDVRTQLMNLAGGNFGSGFFNAGVCIK